MGETYEYEADSTRMVGYRARPDAPNGAGLVLAPAFAGLRDFEMAQADRFAGLGYDVLAADYYGDGWRTDDRNDAAARMAELQNDRPRLLRRMKGALAQMETAKIGAFGFCFGGKAVIDLARAGDTDGVVSLHGIYDQPPLETRAMPPVLLCHGWQDPLADPEAFAAMAAELEAHCPDWHALALGGTGHAFTNPAQAGSVPGMGYVEASARRSWRAVEAFFADILLA
ncbi:MAG: dienelactone hydrolase family protein [Pseudomonadota bacterium]